MIEKQKSCPYCHSLIGENQKNEVERNPSRVSEEVPIVARRGTEKLSGIFKSRVFDPGGRAGSHYWAKGLPN